MKRILCGAFAACLAASIPGAAMGEPQGQDAIFVEANTPMAQWVHAVSLQLDRNLRTMGSVPAAQMPNDYVQIRFEVNDGKASRLHMVHATGDPMVDAQARLAVRRLSTLRDMPDSASGMPVLANIIVAKDARGFQSASEALSRAEASRIASGEDGPVLALTTVGTIGG